MRINPICILAGCVILLLFSCNKQRKTNENVLGETWKTTEWIVNGENKTTELQSLEAHADLLLYRLTGESENEFGVRFVNREFPTVWPSSNEDTIVGTFRYVENELVFNMDVFVFPSEERYPISDINAVLWKIKKTTQSVLMLEADFNGNEYKWTLERVP